MKFIWDFYLIFFGSLYKCNIFKVSFIYHISEYSLHEYKINIYIQWSKCQGIAYLLIFIHFLISRFWNALYHCEMLFLTSVDGLLKKEIKLLCIRGWANIFSFNNLIRYWQACHCHWQLSYFHFHFFSGNSIAACNLHSELSRWFFFQLSCQILAGFTFNLSCGDTFVCNFYIFSVTRRYRSDVCYWLTEWLSKL